MTAPIAFQILTDQFWLSAERVMFWEQEAALIVSDLHFGKTGHFRKNGINVPQAVYKEDLLRLVDQIVFFKPKKIIAVGDLFHSKANQEIEQFAKIRADFSMVEILLVKGNHDILPDSFYERLQIIPVHERYSIGSFDFVHDAAMNDETNQEHRFCFTGHMHPAVRIKGNSKQQLQFPCFFFTKHMGILPAFSKFSGTALVQKKKDNTIFACVNQSLIKIGNGNT